MYASRRLRAFTMIELLLAMSIGAITLSGLALGSIALQRSFAVANYQMNAQNDQLRVLDYFSRDLHMASAVAILNGGAKLSVSVPAGDSNLVELNLGVALNSLLGTAASAPTASAVAYYLEGGQLIREVDGTQTVLADTVADVTFIRQGTYLTSSILFTPRFSASPSTAAIQNTRATNCVYLRNASQAN